MQLPEIFAVAHEELYTAGIDAEAAGSHGSGIVKVDDGSKNLAVRAQVELDPATSCHGRPLRRSVWRNICSQWLHRASASSPFRSGAVRSASVEG